MNPITFIAISQLQWCSNLLLTYLQTAERRVNYNEIPLNGQTIQDARIVRGLLQKKISELTNAEIELGSIFIYQKIIQTDTLPKTVK